MDNSKKEAIRAALEKSGSLEALLDGIVRSESKEFRRHQQGVEQGTDHPSHELLREYALGRVSQGEDQRLTEHISLCGVCAHEVFKLQYAVQEGKDTVTVWMARLKNFVSALSFPVSIYAPRLEPVRGTMTDQERRYKPGTDLIIFAEAPDDGYVTVFHGCEETGEVELVFPHEVGDNPRVSAGQEIAPITGKVEGPPGQHWFRVCWTRGQLLDYGGSDLQDDDVRSRSVEGFLEALADLPPDDWQVATIEYDVVPE